MNRKIRWMAVAAACVGMGFSMPSCPGQQAMQQEMEALKTKNVELDKRVQTLNTQMTAMNKDMGEVKTLLSQVSSTVLAQKQSIEQLEAAVKAAAAAAAAKPAPKAAKSAGKPAAKSKRKR